MEGNVKRQIEISMSNVQLQQSKLSHLQLFLEEFENGYNKCREHIVVVADELVQKIKSHEVRLIQELDEFREVELKRHNLFDEGLSKKNEKLALLSELCDTLLGYSGSNFLANFKLHREEFDSLKLDTHSVDQTLIELPTVTFSPVKCNTSFGSLNISKPKIASKPYQMKRRTSVALDANSFKQALKFSNIRKNSSTIKPLYGRENKNVNNVLSAPERTRKLSLQVQGNLNKDFTILNNKVLLSAPTTKAKTQFMFSSVGEEETHQCIDENDDDDDTTQLELVWKIGTEGKHAGEINCPSDVAFLSNENLVVADRGNSRLQIFGTNGEILKIIGQNKIKPCRIDVDWNDNIVVTDSMENCVKLFNSNGQYQSTLGKKLFKSGLTFNEPCGIACSELDHRYIISDLETNEVCAYSSESKLVKQFQKEFKKPSYLSASEDKILISDNLNQCVKVFDSGYRYLFECVLPKEKGSTDNYLQYPNGVCIDGWGNIYVADWGSHTVTMFDSNGDYLKHLLTKEDGLYYPAGVAVVENYLAVSNYSESNSSVMLFEFR